MTPIEEKTITRIQQIVQECIAYPSLCGTPEQKLSCGRKPWFYALSFTAAAASWNFYAVLVYSVAYSFWAVFTAFTNPDVDMPRPICTIVFLYAIGFFICRLARKVCTYAFNPPSMLLCLVILFNIDIILILIFGWWGIPVVIPLVVTLLAILYHPAYKKWFNNMTEACEKLEDMSDEEIEDSIRQQQEVEQLFEKVKKAHDIAIKQHNLGEEK